jgi:hypothetical protein
LYQNQFSNYVPNYAYNSNFQQNPNIKTDSVGMHYAHTGNSFEGLFGMEAHSNNRPPLNNLLDTAHHSFPWNLSQNSGNLNESHHLHLPDSSRSLPGYQNLTSAEWSMSNLLGSAESMENIAQLLSHFQASSQSIENLNAFAAAHEAKTKKDEKDNDPREHESPGEHMQKKFSDDVGYPIDEPGLTPQVSSKSMGITKMSPPQMDPGIIKQKIESNKASSSNGLGNRFSSRVSIS